MNEIVVDGRAYPVVPKYYRMDPQAEDLLSNSCKLRDGMMVLVASSDYRPDPVQASGDERWVQERVLERNRWCMVTEITWLNDHTFEFTGTYEDESKIRRGPYDSNIPWLVKLDSFPLQITSDGRYESVYAIVKKAMEWEDGWAEDDALICDRATGKILNLFNSDEVAKILGATG